VGVPLCHSRVHEYGATRPTHRGSVGQTPTTAQSPGALLKSARDFKRKDKGLNSGRARLPMLTLLHTILDNAFKGGL
jgi:hypothetical protein